LLDQRLPPELQRELDAHLAGCEACRAVQAAERELTALLEEKLPQHPASLALKRRLAERMDAARLEDPAPTAPGARRFEDPAAREQVAQRFEGPAATTLRAPRFDDPATSRRAWRLVPLAGAAAVVLAAALLPIALRHRSAPPIAAEAVSDHLRVLEGELPLQIVSSGIHEVKPWFAGRLDFAPVIAFAGDSDYPLQGGAVARFLDRRAALLVYKRREHRISLLVLRPDGLDWPASRTETVRGFHLLLWRKGDLAYALISDLDERELGALAAKLR
jgi:anti-sigma factor RsiW